MTNETEPRITIPAITLYQPWASWVLLGWKTIETRLHARMKSLKGRRIAIHAGKTWDSHAVKHASNYLPPGRADHTRSSESVWPRGAVIGTVFVLDFRTLFADNSRQALIDCGETLRYGMFLSGARELKRPIATRGFQGIFTVSIPADELAGLSGLPTLKQSQPGLSLE
jgi:hypothetical protein